jgi:hypothetical protein
MNKRKYALIIAHIVLLLALVSQARAVYYIEDMSADCLQGWHPDCPDASCTKELSVYTTGCGYPASGSEYDCCGCSISVYVCSTVPGSFCGMASYYACTGYRSPYAYCDSGVTNQCIRP